MRSVYWATFQRSLKMFKCGEIVLYLWGKECMIGMSDVVWGGAREGRMRDLRMGGWGWPASIILTSASYNHPSSYHPLQSAQPHGTYENNQVSREYWQILDSSRASPTCDRALWGGTLGSSLLQHWRTAGQGQGCRGPSSGGSWRWRLCTRTSCDLFFFQLNCVDGKYRFKNCYIGIKN